MAQTVTVAAQGCFARTTGGHELIVVVEGLAALDVRSQPEPEDADRFNAVRARIRACQESRAMPVPLTLPQSRPPDQAHSNLTQAGTEQTAAPPTRRTFSAV